MNLKGKKVLVYGYSRSGHAATELLIKNGASVLIYDDAGVSSEMPLGANLISNLRQGIKDADLIVISPAIKINHPELERARVIGKEIIGEIELAYLFCDCDIIAITGTNGKTTTTLIITEILNRAGRFAHALGNIGIAFSEKVAELTQNDIAVLEVSSFQLESIKYFSPDISVLLNIAPDHIDHHGCFERYIEAKQNIFKNQIEKDFALINADDEICMKISENTRAKKYFISLTQNVRGAYIEQDDIFFEDKSKIYICGVEELTLKGDYNLQNILASVAVCMIMGINPEIIRCVLKSFDAPEYRNEYIGEKHGKHFYNDSKGTNIAATLASAKSMDGRTVLIMGGSDKGENYDTLFSLLPDKIVHIFVTGENAPKIIESALSCGYYNISFRATLNECVQESITIKAENVLFSPASASFDKYRNYRERGEAFLKCFEEMR